MSVSTKTADPPLSSLLSSRFLLAELFADRPRTDLTERKLVTSLSLLEETMETRLKLEQCGEVYTLWGTLCKMSYA